MIDNHLYPMRFVAKRLDISLSTAYSIFRPYVRGCVSSASVVHKLNETRVHGAPIQSIPGDLQRIERVAARIFVVKSRSAAISRMRRFMEEFRVPHFRLNSHTILFSNSDVDKVLSQVSQKEVVL